MASMMSKMPPGQLDAIASTMGMSKEDVMSMAKTMMGGSSAPAKPKPSLDMARFITKLEGVEDFTSAQLSGSDSESDSGASSSENESDSDSDGEDDNVGAAT